MSVASAGYLRAIGSVRAEVIGRHLFDITNGWNGVPAVGSHVFVVTHEPPVGWALPNAPFTFVTDGVASAVAQASRSPAMAMYRSRPATSAGRPWRPAWSTKCT